MARATPLEPDSHELRRTPEPDHAPWDATVHPAHRRLLHCGSGGASYCSVRPECRRGSAPGRGRRDGPVGHMLRCAIGAPSRYAFTRLTPVVGAP